MTDALVFLIRTFFDVIAILFLVRLLLQASRADFYNPISQGVVQVTEPVLRPMRLVIPGFRNIDMASFIAAVLAKLIGLGLITLLQAGILPLWPLFLRALFDTLYLLLTIYWIGILIIVVLSFIAPTSAHPAALLVRQIVEPILAPARRLLPPLGGLDLSPIIVFVGLILVRDYLLPELFRPLF